MSTPACDDNRICGPLPVSVLIQGVAAAPHIGHLYSMVLADALKRWQLVDGKSALLCTGTDEHGMKIQRAAALLKLPPKQLCDLNSGQFADLARRGDISHDFFVRTTD